MWHTRWWVPVGRLTVPLDDGSGRSVIVIKMRGSGRLCCGALPAAGRHNPARAS
ncbi:hypothetical protein GCM10010448_70870 [Streptomyces glomeratus]|uniref:Uncharacterized protein n=1 Tax=Streptomyces glomeratus TaxID=284452 RepID=A0ABP6M5K5_9ACTN